MKKILVLGATGMAGHLVYQYLYEFGQYKLYNACFRTKYTDDSVIVNIRNEDAVKNIIQSIKPDVIINCVGILIKGSKESPENCIFINAYFPHMVSRLLHQIVPDSQLIHISTDCVFSGSKGFYKDCDTKDALDVYGMTKNLGELNNDSDLTIRTSIIGPELKSNGEGLFHWVFQQRQNKELNGYTKSLWGGITTLELAKVITDVLKFKITGLYQVSNNIPISKYSLIFAIVKEFDLPIQVNSVDGVVSDKSIQNTKRLDFNHDVPDYEVMLKDLHLFMVNHKKLYPQYLENI